MDPHTPRSEAERWLGIAEKLLASRDLVGSRSFAIRARESDPTNPTSEQILAVVDTLMAAEKRVINSGHYDWYSILQLSHLVRDPDLIASHYRRLVLLLNPDHNHLPYADFAIRVVFDAWSVLSDPAKKWMYDSELAVFLQRGNEPSEPARVDSSSAAAATYQFFHQPTQQQPQQQQWIPHHLQQQEPVPVQLQEQQLFRNQNQQRSKWEQQQQRSAQWLPQHQHHQQPIAQRPQQWLPEQQRPPPPPPQALQQQQAKEPAQFPPQLQRQQPTEPAQFPPQLQRQQQQQPKSPPPQLQRQQQPKSPPQLQRQQQSKEPQFPPQLQRQQQQSKEPSFPPQLQRQQQQQPKSPPQLQRQQQQQPKEPTQFLPPQLQRQQPAEPQFPPQLQRQQQQQPTESQIPPQLHRQQESQIPPQLQRQQESQIPPQLQQQQPQTQPQQQNKTPTPPPPAPAPPQQTTPPHRPLQQMQKENNVRSKEDGIGRGGNVVNEKATDNGDMRNDVVDNGDYHDGGGIAGSFWTACPYCYHLYEYSKAFEECTLRCQNCRRAFQAVQVPNPPGAGDEASFCSWGFFPIGFSMTSWKKSAPSGNGVGANWTPFSPMFACPVQQGAKTKKWMIVDASDDDEDLEVSSDDSDSSGEWGSNRKKVKRANGRSRRGRPPGRKSNAEREKMANQRSAGGENSQIPRNDVVNNNTTNTAVASGSLKKQTGKGVRGRKKLDLNVEFSNEVEDHAAAARDGNGEEIGFFEGLDEFLSTLPILHVVGDDKAKPS